MKLKKIENAVVHCRTREEAEELIKQLCEKEKWVRIWDKNKENTCYAIGRCGSIAFYGMEQYFLERKYEITEFSDLIEQEEQNPVLTAEEAIEWLCKHYYDGEYGKAFGENCRTDHLLDEMSAEEVARKIAQWKSEHEKPEKKEPELEWVDVCRIIEIDCDVKRCVYEEELPFYGDERENVESILKRYISEHDGNYFAFVEHVCRVKKD